MYKAINSPMLVCRAEPMVEWVRRARVEQYNQVFPSLQGNLTFELERQGDYTLTSDLVVELDLGTLSLTK